MCMMSVLKIGMEQGCPKHIEKQIWGAGQNSLPLVDGSMNKHHINLPLEI